MLSVREVLGLLGPGGYIVYKYIYICIYIYCSTTGGETKTELQLTAGSIT